MCYVTKAAPYVTQGLQLFRSTIVQVFRSAIIVQAVAVRLFCDRGCRLYSSAVGDLLADAKILRSILAATVDAAWFPVSVKFGSVDFVIYFAKYCSEIYDFDTHILVSFVQQDRFRVFAPAAGLV